MLFGKSNWFGPVGLIVNIGESVHNLYIAASYISIADFEVVMICERVTENVAVLIFAVVGVEAADELDFVAVFEFGYTLCYGVGTVSVVVGNCTGNVSVGVFTVEDEFEVDAFAVEQSRDVAVYRVAVLVFESISVIVRDSLTVDSEPVARGVGDKVTVSLHHAAIFMLSTGVVSAQYGNSYPKDRREVICPTNNVFRTADDKLIAVCAPEYDRTYDKIMRLVGREDLVGDERYNNCDRLNETHKNSEVVDILDAAIKKFTRAEILNIFKSNDIPCEGCYEPVDMYEDEQVWANDIMTKLDCPSGKRNIATAPVKFASNANPKYVVTRAQGSDTIEVMKEYGYTDAQIEEYLAEGAVVGKTALRK